MKKNKKSNEQVIEAYTDASCGPRKEGSGAIVLKHAGTSLLDSIHVLNFGFKKGSAYNELRANIEALHLAPEGQLKRLFSDCQGNIINFNKLKINLRDDSFRKMLSVKEFIRLHEGLERQPNVEFIHVKRKDPNIKIADTFSRVARGCEEDSIQEIPMPIARTREAQLEQLYKKFDIHAKLQSKRSQNVAMKFLKRWVLPSKPEAEPEPELI